MKRLSSRLANGFRDLLLRDGIRIPAAASQGGAPRLVSAPARLQPHAPHILALIQAQGPHVPWPVNHRPRQAGVSKYGVWNRLWVGLVDVVGVWWLQRRSKVVEIREMLE